ncbi:MAG: phosphatase PAP2 family protein [Spirosomataceae bacterium]
MIENIKYWEYEFFLWLNSHHSPFWDSVMIIATHRFTWIPLYILIIVYIFIEKKSEAFNFKNGLNPIKVKFLRLVYIIASVGLADRFTSGFMKPYFERLRPCHDPTVSNVLHLVGNCGGQYGFASSHASNSFALALCFYLLYRKTNKYSWVLFIWAAIVSYSRVYIGVHYPTDILVGAIVGMLISIGGFMLFSYKR